jgi:hypothetical protein
MAMKKDTGEVNGIDNKSKAKAKNGRMPEEREEKRREENRRRYDWKQ